MDIKIILKEINGEVLSPKEKEEFENWYGTSAEHRSFYDHLKQGEGLKESDIDTKEAWKRLAVNLEKRIIPRKKWPYWAAASIVLLLLVGSLFFKNHEEAVVEVAPVVIEAGTDKAVLTLEDGSEVTLKKDDILALGNVEVKEDRLRYQASSEPGQQELKYNVLSVPKGGQYKVVLADGTQVWLNSDTKLKYPVAFRSGEPRRVELLYGEAFFEVTPSDRHNGDRFQVKSEVQLIEVLGTSFNIAHYKEEEAIETTLVEGEVALSNTLNSSKKTIKPGNQAVFTKQQESWEIHEVDTDLVVAWKSGYFKFKEKTLEEIMKAISRWYDVEVRFVDEQLRTVKFNGVFKKDQKLEDILDILRIDGSLDYTVKDRELLLSNPVNR